MAYESIHIESKGISEKQAERFFHRWISDSAGSLRRPVDSWSSLLAEGIAVIAYFLLVIGVVLQLVAFARASDATEDEQVQAI